MPGSESPVSLSSLALRPSLGAGTPTCTAAIGCGRLAAVVCADNLILLTLIHPSIFSFTGKLTADLVALDDTYSWFRSRLILGGRSPASLQPLAERTNLPFRAFSLTDQDIDTHLHDVRVVIHMAGPFIATAEPMLRACIRTRTHYLDITGEMPVFDLVYEKMRAEIEAAGILAICGVGFDIVPTDCLAAQLAQALPDGTHLELGIAPTGKGANLTAGTASSAVEGMANPNMVMGPRIDGKIVNKAPGYKSKYIDFPTAGRKFTSFIPWGDCYTAYISTSIPNVDVYFPSVWPLDTVTYYGSPLLQLALKVPGVKPTLLSLIRKFVTGPSAEASATGRVDVWGHVRNAVTGESVSGYVVLPEGYKFTGLAALESARRVFEGRVKKNKGSLTPSLAFGWEYVKDIPGVSVGEVTVHEVKVDG
ncbi:Saccharopine dehydrogenase-domain-containing protein [Catenaria anguillulae PL171]|uniref:Saccharopine dehydrogenase-domain-containing protein n=1 Tax=Catenaria anguillulae PL171 TaxID=765915 RepID=A0A1Y2HNV3_9FUNG|nr:Saccharopine dehydrogenase-domain-containing protein [Catenaria anguillulae PL171]